MAIKVIGKKISEVPERTQLTGDEFVPYAENGSQGKIKLSTIKDYSTDTLKAESFAQVESTYDPDVKKVTVQFKNSSGENIEGAKGVFEIDTTDFVIDGMLKNVYLVTIKDDGTVDWPEGVSYDVPTEYAQKHGEKFLVFCFNVTENVGTGEPINVIWVSVNELFNDYDFVATTGNEDYVTFSVKEVNPTTSNTANKVTYTVALGQKAVDDFSLVEGTYVRQNEDAPIRGIIDLHDDLVAVEKEISSNARYKQYTIDCYSLDAGTFYPIVLRSFDMQIDCLIYSQSKEDPQSPNLNLVDFKVSSKASYDVKNNLVILTNWNWDDNEICIGSIGLNQVGRPAAVIFVSGGTSYFLKTNATPTLYTESYTSSISSGSSMTVVPGTSITGGENVNIDFYWKNDETRSTNENIVAKLKDISTNLEGTFASPKKIDFYTANIDEIWDEGVYVNSSDDTAALLVLRCYENSDYFGIQILLGNNGNKVRYKTPAGISNWTNIGTSSIAQSNGRYLIDDLKDDGVYYINSSLKITNNFPESFSVEEGYAFNVEGYFNGCIVRVFNDRGSIVQYIDLFSFGSNSEYQPVRQKYTRLIRTWNDNVWSVCMVAPISNSFASKSKGGYMSSEDKVKLDGLSDAAKIFITEDPETIYYKWFNENGGTVADINTFCRGDVNDLVSAIQNNYLICYRRLNEDTGKYSVMPYEKIQDSSESGLIDVTLYYEYNGRKHIMLLPGLDTPCVGFLDEQDSYKSTRIYCSEIANCEIGTDITQYILTDYPVLGVDEIDLYTAIKGYTDTEGTVGCRVLLKEVYVETEDDSYNEEYVYYMSKDSNVYDKFIKFRRNADNTAFILLDKGDVTYGAELSDTLPLQDASTASAGTSEEAARADHVHPIIPNSLYNTQILEEGTDINYVKDAGVYYIRQYDTPVISLPELEDGREITRATLIVFRDSNNPIMQKLFVESEEIQDDRFYEFTRYSTNSRFSAFDWVGGRLGVTPDFSRTAIQPIHPGYVDLNSLDNGFYIIAGAAGNYQNYPPLSTGYNNQTVRLLVLDGMQIAFATNDKPKCEIFIRRTASSNWYGADIYSLINAPEYIDYNTRFNTVTTLTGIPIDKKTVIANVSTNQEWSLDVNMTHSELRVIVNNNSADSITINMLTDGYKNISGNTLTLPGNSTGIVDVVYDGITYYTTFQAQ